MAQKKEADALRAKAEAYFAACDSTRERVALKNGEVTYYQVPYTMAGLCASLGVPREALEKARRGGQEGGGRDAALAWAAARVEQHLVERALLGELNAGVATILLKEWGYGDAAPSGGESGEKTLTVMLEDPEELAR